MRYFSNKKIIAVFLVALLIIFLHYLGALNWVERYISLALNPAQKFFFSQGIKLSELYNDRDSQNLEEKNAALEQQLQMLLAENVSLHILQDENESLRNQLQFYEKYNYQKKLANVIGKTTNSDQRQIITIDAGLSKGIKINQPVVVGNGVIIGKIIKTEDMISYACVITDKNCHIAATMAKGIGPSGLTQGDLGLTVNIDFVPQNEPININDIIITSGLEPEIPKGLLLGEVQDIKNEPNNLFKTAVINPVADLNAISIVSIIIN